MNNVAHVCAHCQSDLSGSNPCRKYCSAHCKQQHRKALGFRQGKAHIPVTEHMCRICGKIFPIGPEQGNKWLCSDVCRRASIAQSVGNFHRKYPTRAALYNARTKNKRLPSDNLARFYKHNAAAPHNCEACGEDRVLEVAHKPGHERNGSSRSRTNCKWPDKVWVLCPTCHKLLDRMHYDPSELGLL